MEENKMKECLIHEDFLFKLMEVGLIFEDKPQLFRTLDKPDILAIDSNKYKSKYEKAYHLLMMYFDSIADEEKEYVSKELNKIGL